MLFFIPLLLFLSCRITLVPEFNAQLAEQISKAAQMNDRLYIDMLDAAPQARKYEQFKERYNAIESEINLIRLKNEARDKNEHFLVINNNLRQAFDEARAYHKTNDSLTNGEIKSYQKTIAGFWRPLYLAEMGLGKIASK